MTTRKLSTPFAVNSSLKNTVPISATSEQTKEGLADYTNGWTAINKLPIENGGQPPYMEDMNGLLGDITGNIVDLNKGLPQYFDSAYSTLIGGYPLGSRLCLNDNSGYVVSTIDNNTNDPNTSMSGWVLAENLSLKSRIDVVESISALANESTWNGRAVNVLSYNKGEDKGGGYFVYDSTQASVNNGITIFNGWVRDLSDRRLSTDDAGMSDSTDNRAVLIQSLVDLLQNNFTLEINCKVLVNTQIVIQNKNGIKVKFASNGLLSAKEYRSSFVHWGTAGNRGILTFIDCTYPQVFEPKIIGAKSINLNVTETRAEGDALIHFKRCMHYSVQGGDCSHAYTWGIMGEGSSYGIVNKAKVSDVCVQGGISLSLSGGSNNTVTNCDVSNCGLVGIEWESADDTKVSVGNVAIGNYVYDCMKGTTVITNIHGLTSSNNRYARCAYGFIGATNIDISSSIELLTVSDNVFIDCPETLTAYNSAKFSINNNILYAPTTDQYVIQFPYDVLLDMPSSTTFRANVDASYVVGDKLKIGTVSTIYNVTSVDTITDDTYKMGQLKVITVDSTLDSSIEPCTNVRKLNNLRHAITTRYQNSSIRFTGNTLYNYTNALIPYLEASSDEFYTQNNFINCNSLVYTPIGTANGLKFWDNNIYGSSTYDLSSNAISNNRYLDYFPDFKYIEVFNSARQTTGVSIPTVHFNLPVNTQIKGFRVVFPMADFATTGSVLVVKVDGNDTVALGKGGVDTVSTTFNYFGLIGAGNHTIQIVDNVGDLTYSKCIIDLVTI